MEARYFVAIIERGPRGRGFGVYFPDLPGCVSAGDTVEEAARNAEEALSLHLRGMIEDGGDIPPSSPPHRIEADPESDEAARFLVRGRLPSRAVRLNISLDKGLLAKIDRAAEARSQTRSGFIAQAARKALEGIE